MKKLWLFLSLLICSILVAGCNFTNNKILDWDWMINEADESEINVEDLYWIWILHWFDGGLLLISENKINAVFCNSFEIDNWKIEWNTLKFDKMTKEGSLICTWDRIYLTNYEEVFDISNAHIELLEGKDKLTITTPKTDYFIFNKVDVDNGSKNEPEIVEKPEIINLKDLPKCESIDIDENIEIINIDDVAKNCRYQEWTAWSFAWWGCGWLMTPLAITKNAIWYDVWWVGDSDYTKGICYTDDYGSMLVEPKVSQESFVSFLEKYNFREKHLIRYASQKTTEDAFRNACGNYFCDDEELCSQFRRPSRWENENHYYVYGIRNDWGDEVLVVDDNIYNIWKYEYIFSEYSRPNPVKEWRRVVYWLSWDKLIVKKYVDWEIIPPYTKDNYFSYDFETPTTTTKFKIKTCEIDL